MPQSISHVGSTIAGDEMIFRKILRHIGRREAKEMVGTGYSRREH
jgi:hypothetical protein